jgi:hypothetical protein
VTLIVGIIVALTFLFGFGNVLKTLALKLQVPVFVAPLVASAVDLTPLEFRRPFCHSTMPSMTLLVMVKMLCQDTSAP